MPEGLKVQSESPVARAGAGDISERELSRERYTLQTTPPTRVQPAHPKKQLFSVPVNKFTAKASAPSPNRARLRSCLEQYRAGVATPARPVRVRPKAVSMEDLTPTKRSKNIRLLEEIHSVHVGRRFVDKNTSHAPMWQDPPSSVSNAGRIAVSILKLEDTYDKNEIAHIREDSTLEVVRSPGLRSAAEEQAAMKVFKFMLLTTWRRRRDEVRCLRKTLEYQVSCSERLRIQVSTLKALLDSDNAKVRLAMRELERLKHLLRDKDIEKALLQREKLALERDVCAAQDQASEMSIGWHNCRNELEGVRAGAAACERALANERAAAADARAQRDLAFRRLSIVEEELSQHEALLSSAEAEAAALRREADERARQLEITAKELRLEQEARSECSRECAVLGARVSAAAEETSALRATVELMRAEVQRLDHALAVTREQLDWWWPRPLTKMLGAARSWLRHPMSFPEAMLWSLIPARHGC